MAEKETVAAEKSGGDGFDAIGKSVSLRFIGVGTGNTLVGLSVFPAVYFSLGGLTDSLNFLLLVSWLITGSLAFATQRRLVFRVKSRVLHRAGKFLLLQCSLFTANSIALHTVVRELGFGPVPGQLLIAPLIVGAGYLASRYWVFREKPSQDKAEI